MAWQGSTRGKATSSRAYRELRLMILRRDRHTCQHCGHKATEVDHILNEKRGGTDHPSNLQALCHPCHTRKTAQEAQTARLTSKRKPERHPGLR